MNSTPNRTYNPDSINTLDIPVRTDTILGALMQMRSESTNYRGDIRDVWVTTSPRILIYGDLQDNQGRQGQTWSSNVSKSKAYLDRPER